MILHQRREVQVLGTLAEHEPTYRVGTRPRRGRKPNYFARKGDTFGKWTVISDEFRNRTRHVRCRCQCGYEADIRVNAIVSGRSKGCRTCIRKNTAAERSIWYGMKDRCSNPSHRGFKNYGGRGIYVCDAWLDFDQFYADMGPRPSPDHSLDRIDNNRGYEPENVRWATSKQQRNNRRVSVQIEYQGRTQPVTEWASELKIGRVTLQHRLKAGWSVEKAFSEPIDLNNSHCKSKEGSIQ